MLILRRISIVFGLLVIIGGFVISNKLGSQKEPPRKIEKAESTKLVQTLVVKNREIKSPVFASGRLHASEKIQLFAEVNGILLQNSKKLRLDD